MEFVMSSFRNFSLHIRPTLVVISQKYKENDDFIDCEKGINTDIISDNTPIEPIHQDESMIYACTVNGKVYNQIDDDPNYLSIPPAKRSEFYSPHFVIDMAGIAF